MKPYEPLTFIHANTKKPIYVSKELLFAHYYSDAHKSTVLLASGGAMIPVQESPDEVTNKLTGGNNNGTK